jgi:hypothetical protein
MTKFDIIGALRSYCVVEGIKFIWQYDEFYANIAATQQYGVNEKILVVDLKPLPQTVGTKVGDITYSGLFMLGQKFDTGGLAASLDETALQKYDRRLLALTSSLVNTATDFACDNGLMLTFSQIDYLFNAFDSGIDFVVCQNISFLQ